MVVPLSWFGGLKINEKPLDDEEEKSSVTAVLRRSHRQSVRRSQQSTENFNKRQSTRAIARTSKNASLRSAGRSVKQGQGVYIGIDNSMSINSKGARREEREGIPLRPASINS